MSGNRTNGAAILYRNPNSGLFGESPFKRFTASLSLSTPQELTPKGSNISNIPIILVKKEAEVLEAARRAPWLQYGLVVTDPGDTAALVKAAAISLQRKPPPALAGKKADRARGAKGRLLKVQGEGENTHLQFVDFINPALFDV